MELINKTKLAAACSVGLDTTGRELLVVAVKGTFTLPRPGERLTLRDEQVPLVTAEMFSGDPAASAPVYEADFAPRKHRCDVLLVGSARAPIGHVVRRMRVRMKVGPIDKQVDVVGDRVWRIGLTGISASDPEPFERIPLTYDRAFGGTNERGGNPDEPRDAYLRNPVGRGWYRNFAAARVDRAPLPNLEVPGQPLNQPSDEYMPVAFSPVGRGWPQRARYAGTYDQPWLDDVFPFPPSDFDERYYQAAPEDQQMPIAAHAVDVQLEGVTGDGPRAFTLPHIEAPVAVFPKRGAREAFGGLLDTIVFEPDRERLTLTWRVTRPLKKSIFEIAGIQVGVGGHEGWQMPVPSRTNAA